MPNRRRKVSAARRGMAALIMIAALGLGGWCFWQVADTMQSGTRSGQVLAAFSVRDGVAVYSILGREGEIPLAELQSSLLEYASSLNAPARLLLWNYEGARELWEQYLLPLCREWLPQELLANP